MSLFDITEKIRKGLLPAISDKELAALRVAECEQCEHLRRGLRQCAKCGCQVDLKARIKSASCPIKKW